MGFVFIFQWPELLRFWKQNWINFDLISIRFEAGRYKGRYLESTFVLLGIGFDFEWYSKTDRSVFAADLDQKMAEVRDEEGATVCAMCGCDQIHHRESFIGEDEPTVSP